MQDVPAMLRKAIPHGEMQRIAKGSGLSYSWLVRFRRGQLDNPCWSNLKRLAEYLGV
jgi:hypothetical protein